MPPDGPHPAVDPAITVRDGRVAWSDEDVDAARDGLLGIALDVGTTTVVLQVLDLRTGEALAVGAFENPRKGKRDREERGAAGGAEVLRRLAERRVDAIEGHEHAAGS